MADLINLNKVRKAKTKQRETAKAAENRVVYGLSTRIRKLDKSKQQKRLKKSTTNAWTRRVTIKKVDDL